MKQHAITATALFAVIVLTHPAFAATGGDMPWDSWVQRIIASLSGGVALMVCVVAILAAAFTWMFGNFHTFGQSIIGLVIGLATAAGAVGLASRFGLSAALIG
jgi:type IV secretion system protein VirB2